MKKYQLVLYLSYTVSVFCQIFSQQTKYTLRKQTDLVQSDHMLGCFSLKLVLSVSDIEDSLGVLPPFSLIMVLSEFQKQLLAKELVPELIFCLFKKHVTGTTIYRGTCVEFQHIFFLIVNPFLSIPSSFLTPHNFSMDLFHMP